LKKRRSFKTKKNPQIGLPEFDNIEVDVPDTDDDIEVLPLWYKQFMSLDSKQRILKIDKVLKAVKKYKPELFDFLRAFKCQLVGVIPRVAYALPDEAYGDSKATFVHKFQDVTLLYWCPRGKFTFEVSPTMDYNDTVLNHIKGNKKVSIAGLTR
jgi:hypothetical protein